MVTIEYSIEYIIEYVLALFIFCWLANYDYINNTSPIVFTP
jgi:hypothetical protein